MTDILRYCDKYGSYSMTVTENLVTAEVLGSIGDELSLHFHDHIVKCSDAFKTRECLWGYIGDMTNCEGYTMDAELNVMRSNQYAMSKGCMVDAYIIHSPLVLSQLVRMRQQAGIPTPLSDHLFDDMQTANEYVNHVLKKLAQSESDAN